MNIKNFFPEIPEEDFEGFKGAVIESAELGYLEMEDYVQKVKEIKGDKWIEFSYEVISRRKANKLANYVMKSVEKTACGFAMIKQEEDFCAFETFIEMFPPKIAIKMFQDHIDKKRKEFVTIKDKFPGIKEISDKY